MSSMLCKKMLGSLSDYIDGDFEAQLCAEIAQHMAECGDCRIVVDTLSKTVSLYRQGGHEPVPQDAKERLYARLKLEARSWKLEAPQGVCHPQHTVSSN